MDRRNFVRILGGLGIAVGAGSRLESYNFVKNDSVGDESWGSIDGIIAEDEIIPLNESDHYIVHDGRTWGIIPYSDLVNVRWGFTIMNRAQILKNLLIALRHGSSRAGNFIRSNAAPLGFAGLAGSLGGGLLYGMNKMGSAIESEQSPRTRDEYEMAIQETL